MPAKPQPPYARLNQPPRSPNGRNRQAPAKNHSDPLDGTGASAGGAEAKHTYTVRTQLPLTTWRTINSPVLPFDPGAYSNLNLVQAMIDMQKKMLAQVYAIPGGITYIGVDLGVEPPPIPYTGIRSGEITGHRAWLVTDTFDLCSLAHYFVWEPGKTVEGDVEKVVWTSPTGRTPNRFGGVYAYSSFDLLRDDELFDISKTKHRFPHREDMNPSNLSVWDTIKLKDYMRNVVTYLGLAYGTVKLWGETVEHEKGYRASFAKLVSIDGFIGVEGFDLAKLRGGILDKLPEGFQDLPQYIKDDMINRLVNPPMYLPIWFCIAYSPLIGMFNELHTPDWYSYIVLPYVEPIDEDDYE